METALAYRQIKDHAQGEITEKKSRFIGEIFPVQDEDEASSRIQEVQKKYYDARHHCFAYILWDKKRSEAQSAAQGIAHNSLQGASAVGILQSLKRASDDGEPSGTAGRPILDVLTGAELTNTLIVVTRYFGGTLLGTGGLTRAYTQAAKAALSAAEIVTFRYGRLFLLEAEYSQTGNIEYYLRQNNIDIGKPAYGSGVSYELFVPVSFADQFVNDITNISSGKTVILPGDFLYRA